MTEQAQTTDTEFRIDTLIRREADPQDETTERGIFRAAQIIAAEIDRLTAERDAARAQLQEARDKLIEVRDTLHHTNNEFAVILRERNEARAEVERLRPAAEAWELLEHMYHNTGSSLAASYTKACIDKAARARAAKERKP